MVSHDAHTVSAQFIDGSTTTHDRGTTIHHGGATNAHHASKTRYGASTIQASSATLASRPYTNVHDLVVALRQSWEGGTLIFFYILRLGPSIYLQKIPGISSTPKKLKF